MTADLIARCVILGAALIIAMVEFYFVSNAIVAEAEILERVEHIRDSTSEVTPETHDVVVSQRFRVRLDPTTTDGRLGRVSVSESAFEAQSIGDRIDVMCLAQKPFWVFWSTLVRDRNQLGKWNHLFAALGLVAAAGLFAGWQFIFR